MIKALVIKGADVNLVDPERRDTVELAAQIPYT
jgi:hypothetical protein